MDQISEHQRDLTNSASARTYGESINYAVYAAKRLTGTMNRLKVNPDNLQKNLLLQGDLIAAEPLYILLAAYGHPDAHESVRVLTLAAQEKGISLAKAMEEDGALKPFTDQFSEYQSSIIKDPSLYIGKAAERAQSVAETWKARLNL